VARLYNSNMDWGEFIVMVAAVYTPVSNHRESDDLQLTDADNHAGRPTCFLPASFAIFSYTEAMCFGAAVVFGRAWATFMKALRDSDNLDMAETQ